MPHNHQAKTQSYNRAIGIVFNILFVATEAVYGFLAESLALLADAGHNLSDVELNIRHCKSKDQMENAVNRLIRGAYE